MKARGRQPTPSSPTAPDLTEPELRPRNLRPRQHLQRPAKYRDSTYPVEPPATTDPEPVPPVAPREAKKQTLSPGMFFNQPRHLN